MPLRILIFDDHEAAREGLKQLLRDTDIEVRQALPSRSDIVSVLNRQHVDAVLMDVRMAKVDGLTLLAQIRESDHELPVLMFTAHSNPTHIARAAALGANDYLLKSDSRETIVAAIKGAVAGQTPNPNGMFCRVRRLMQSEQMPDGLPLESPLTSREAQVFRHIGLGLSNREIALSLGISVETVKEHVQNLLRKIGANDRTDAAVLAVRSGLVDY